MHLITLPTHCRWLKMRDKIDFHLTAALPTLHGTVTSFVVKRRESCNDVSARKVFFVANNFKVLVVLYLVRDREDHSHLSERRCISAFFFKALPSSLVANITCAQMFVFVCGSHYGTVRSCMRFLVPQQNRRIRHATHATWAKQTA